LNDHRTKFIGLRPFFGLILEEVQRLELALALGARLGPALRERMKFAAAQVSRERD
jgi:hypothetical protein